MIRLCHTSIHPGSLCNSIVVRKSDGYLVIFAGDGSGSQIGVVASPSSLLLVSLHVSQRFCEVLDPIPRPGYLPGGSR